MSGNARLASPRPSATIFSHQKSGIIATESCPMTSSTGKVVLGKVVLITGATDGLGKAAAILFAERGYRVYAAGRSAEKRAQLDQFAQTKNLRLKSLELD